MSDIKQKDVASAALTITLASLASDATNVIVGRQSTAIVNSSNEYLDYLVGGKITTGTSPTAGRVIEVWAYGSVDDTPTYPDVITGTDGGASMTSRDILGMSCRLIASMPTDATSSRTYWFAPASIASLFGGFLPAAWGIFVVHTTGVALHATGSNHVISYSPRYATVV